MRTFKEEVWRQPLAAKQVIDGLINARARWKRRNFLLGEVLKANDRPISEGMIPR